MIRTAMKWALSRTLGPKGYARFARAYSRSVPRTRLLIHAEARRSACTLRSLHNKFRGQTCAIMGNGPSLRATDVHLLADVPTFGLNRIYLARTWLGFDPTFLVCVNRLVLEQCADEFTSLSMPRFFSWKGHELFAPDDGNLTYVHSVPGPFFSTDPTRQGVWEGATVTYVALQLAYYFGFSRVVLVGVDHNFVTKGPAHKEVTSEAGDPNHFDPAYFGPGFRWQLPDLETSEIAYRLARSAYESDDRTIIDATVGGSLTVFPKAELSDLFP